MENSEDKLVEAVKHSDDYYTVIYFTCSVEKFCLVDMKTALPIHDDLTDAFDYQYGICDGCDRTNDRCSCEDSYSPYNNYDDYEYDLRNNR
jgi:hypothetical protein